MQEKSLLNHMTKDRERIVGKKRDLWTKLQAQWSQEGPRQKRERDRDRDRDREREREPRGE